MGKQCKCLRLCTGLAQPEMDPLGRHLRHHIVSEVWRVAVQSHVPSPFGNSDRELRCHGYQDAVWRRHLNV
jgi:hypothetical protein